MSARRTPQGLPSTSARRRRNRRRAAGRRRRSLLIVGIALVALAVAGSAAGGLGAFAAFRAACNLAALRPAPLGRSSPVLAADGSLPAEIWSRFVRSALTGSGWRAFPRVARPARQPWRGRFIAAAKG